MKLKKAIALVLVLLFTLTLTAVLAGCNNSQQQAEQNLSADIQQLTTDMSALLNPATYKSLDSFQAAWKKIGAQYDTTAAAAQDVKNVQFADVKTAYDNLKSSIQNISSSQSLEQNISSVLAAGQQFLTALQDLKTAVSPGK